ncbi:MAG: hypothetical protein AcusKO_50810 [Acuticoccus sp.]
MPSGTFEDFLFDLKAFESGWDRERYDDGIIVDAQLDQWAGGSVEDYFPQYESWSELTAEEWDAMSYRSMNSYGFVGYQFGEALLIDLGYYDDDVYYLNGASTNTWDGTWTGKNGATSLEAFMTAEVQDKAIVDAFGFNLDIIEDQLAPAGASLDDYLGQTASYVENGQTVTVELTLTGVLAAAHLRGAWAVADLLLQGTLSFDEYGTSILQYMTQFGGYDSPTVESLIADWEAGLTGDEGLGTPGDGGAAGDGTSDDDLGTAGVTADTADVVVDWDWGTHESVAFDPETDTVYVGWIDALHFDVAETADGVVLSVTGNDQSITLEGATLDDLSPANFTFEDGSAAAEVFALIGEDAIGSRDPDPDPTPVDPDPTPVDPPEVDDPDPAGTGEVFFMTWDWGQREKIRDFDPVTDQIDFGNLQADQIAMREARDGDLIIKVLDNGGHLYRFDGVSASDLSEENLTAPDWNDVVVVTALDLIEGLG